MRSKSLAEVTCFDPLVRLPRRPTTNLPTHDGAVVSAARVSSERRAFRSALRARGRSVRRRPCAYRSRHAPAFLHFADNRRCPRRRCCVRSWNRREIERQTTVVSTVEINYLDGVSRLLLLVTAMRNAMFHYRQEDRTREIKRDLRFSGKTHTRSRVVGAAAVVCCVTSSTTARRNVARIPTRVESTVAITRALRNCLRNTLSLFLFLSSSFRTFHYTNCNVRA